MEMGQNRYNSGCLSGPSILEVGHMKWGESENHFLRTVPQTYYYFPCVPGHENGWEALVLSVLHIPSCFCTFDLLTCILANLLQVLSAISAVLHCSLVFLCLYSGLECFLHVGSSIISCPPDTCQNLSSTDGTLSHSQYSWMYSLL